MIKFPATDGYALSGILYAPNVLPKANVLVACATGVPQAFYRRFAEYLTQFGYQVLTFDYRGVAASAPQKLKGFEISYLDWGKYDVSGAIQYLKQNDIPLFMIGHSYGGQSLGLTSNHEHVKMMISFGTGTGWSGYMPTKEKIKVKIIWNIVFPPLVALTGYLPWSKFNMGADLPKGVYSEWRKWCKHPTYFFADTQLRSELLFKFSQVKTPIIGVSSLDDDWALPNSRYSFMQHYSSSAKQFINISPEDVGMQHIGHMGYFRKDATKIWDKIAQKFDQLI
ncbi:alpha/beta hydrolase family protein [Acinetobacter silvestris]|uniref:Alpha/beta hydrolase n=1 Tax=Acinetobacter silvestris TaxID=1977882 RepID=A0A1Y3CEM2_9GAMM|nr:alpha/beta hydrolase [Acinetobacter silvestris]OTG65559.1 alpha/beta hydrolase [Acinetobacter silvestris]